MYMYTYYVKGDTCFGMQMTGWSEYLVDRQAPGMQIERLTGDPGLNLKPDLQALPQLIFPHPKYDLNIQYSLSMVQVATV